jgi:hypothetical protein
VGLLAAAGLLATAVAASAQSAPALQLPGAGAVTGIAETRVRDGFDQRIRFEGGDGRNHAEIGLRNETGDLLLAFPPRLAKPSQLGIEGEIAVRFPGQVMRVLASPRRNAYGPVGMAVGADCLYAWQWFERSRAGPRPQAQYSLFGPLSEPTAGRRALSLRIRLCRTARASLNDLIGAVERMVITLPTGNGLVGVAPPLVRSAPPVRRAARRVAPAPEAARSAPPEPARTTAPRQAPPAEPPAAPPRALVPPPPQPSPPEAGPAASTPPAAGAGGAQRFITDGLKPADAPGTNLTPSPAPGRGTGESLSRDLPSEAYQPPPKRNGP